MDPVTMSAITTAANKGVAALAGGAAGAASASSNKKELYDLAAKSEQQKKDIAAQTGMRVRELEELYGPQLEGFDSNTKNYYDSLKGADFSKYDVAAPGEFDFDLAAETQRQLNPELQAIIDRSTGTVQQSAANAGKLFSGAAGKGIARSTADIQAKEWDAASGRAQQAYQNKYQAFIDKFKNAVTASDMNKANFVSGIGAKKDLFTSQQTAFGKKTDSGQDLLNADQTAQQKLQSQFDALTSKAHNMPTGASAFLQGAAGALGATASTEK